MNKTLSKQKSSSTRKNRGYKKCALVAHLSGLACWMRHAAM
ncbi:hypothetical protein [Salinivibrio sp. IB282]|nr:hypothetical protein [Salinivibrio sp. IB282]